MEISTLHPAPTLSEFRSAVRAGAFTGPTSAIAPGRLQVNLTILPESYAAEFRAFCDANPKPCPLLAMSDPGSATLRALGADIDLRRDVPGYRVWENGMIAAEPNDIIEYWRDDLVAFALGCSFGFDAALIQAGLPLPHTTEGRNVPMYDTTLPLTERGAFGGNMVVSLRQFSPDELDRAIEISGHYPQCHGKPVHVGDPAEIGIMDIRAPEYGDPPIGEGITAFWACGVTPQAALRRAKLPFAITHSPGKMLVCDVDASWNQILNAPS